jgi:hypothetical protein
MRDTSVRLAVCRVLTVNSIRRGLQQVVARLGHERPVAKKTQSLLFVPLLTKHDVKVCLSAGGSDWIHSLLFYTAAGDSIKNAAHHSANFPFDFLVKVQKHSLCPELACDSRSYKRNRNQNDIQKPIINDRFIMWQLAMNHLDFLLSVTLTEVQNRSWLTRNECDQLITDEFDVILVTCAFHTTIEGQMRSIRKTNVGGWRSHLCWSHRKNCSRKVSPKVSLKGSNLVRVISADGLPRREK